MSALGARRMLGAHLTRMRSIIDKRIGDMTDNILYLLAILVVANILLIAVAIGRSLMRRRRARHEAMLRPAIAARPMSGAPQPVGVDRGPILAATRDGHAAQPRTDPLTGLLLPGEWNRIIADEAARIHRYGRAATVVVIELDGLDRVVNTLGPEAGERILPALADVLSRQARGADHLARLGTGRFAVLLPETDEVAAVNYVERVRLACELWLESGAIAMRLAIGWAAPPKDGDLGDAVVLAQDRMFVELRRSARRATDLATDGPPTSRDFGGAPSPV